MYPINNNTTKQSAVADLTLSPTGYEPSNSLRRMSSAARPTQLKQDTSKRRRSALDKPAIIDGLNQELTSSNALAYEPENSLCRVRKVSDQSQNMQRRSRERRNAVVMDNPTHSYIAFKSEENERKNLPVAFSKSHSSDTLNTYSSSPVVARAAKKPLFSLSIPEDEQVKNEHDSSQKPKQTRRISSNRMSPNLSLTIAANTNNSASLAMSRWRQSPVTSSPTTTKRPTRFSLGSLTSNSSSPQLNRFSVASPESLDDKPTKKVFRNQSSGRHTNCSRYWNWYVHNASYSWHNFNTDNIYCY